MTFKKGMPAVNPGGLTPREKAARFRLQGLSLKAIDKLEEILDSGTNGEKLTAAREVLDRALGRAKIRADIEVSHSTSGHLDALVAIAANTAARVGYAGPVPGGVPGIDAQVIDAVVIDTNEDNKEHVNAGPEIHGAHGEKTEKS